MSLLTQELKTIVKEFLNPPLRISNKTREKYEDCSISPPVAIKFDKEKSKFQK